MKKYMIKTSFVSHGEPITLTNKTVIDTMIFILILVGFEAINITFRIRLISVRFKLELNQEQNQN